MEKKNNVDVVCSCDRKEIRCYGEQRDNSSLGEMHGNRTGPEFVNKWHAKTLIRVVFMLRVPNILIRFSFIATNHVLNS